jgi:hypothetical protein
MTETPERSARVTHPRLRPRRGGGRATTWWGKAWVRACEESAYGEAAMTELDDDELRDLVTLRREDSRREGREPS